MFHYLGAQHRANLAQYKYASGGSSIVSTYVLGPYWNWLVTLVPLSVAPNTLTLCGLLLVVANLGTMMYLDGDMELATRVRMNVMQNDGAVPKVPILPNGGVPERLLRQGLEPSTTSGVPSWMLLVWAICLFMYQSFDAIDGKQARRTGMSGPLGELFDHGCDALNTTLEVILASTACGYGRSYWTLVSMVSSLASFFLTTWEEYHTHVLFLSQFSGPVEGILLLCVLYTAMALGGPMIVVRGLLDLFHVAENDWVRTHLAWANFPLGDVLMSLASLGLSVNAWQAYQNVRVQCEREQRSALMPLVGLMPFVVQVCAHIAWALGNDARIMVEGSLFVPFLLSWGLSFAYLVGLVILAHVCKRAYPYWNALLVPSIMLAVDAHLPQPILQTSVAATQQLVYGVVGICAVLYAYFVYDVILTITQVTGKPCFRVPEKPHKL